MNNNNFAAPFDPFGAPAPRRASDQCADTNLAMQDSYVWGQVFETTPGWPQTPNLDPGDDDDGDDAATCHPALLNSTLRRFRSLPEEAMTRSMTDNPFAPSNPAPVNQPTGTYSSELPSFDEPRSVPQPATGNQGRSSNQPSALLHPNKSIFESVTFDRDPAHGSDVGNHNALPNSAPASHHSFFERVTFDREPPGGLVADNHDAPPNSAPVSQHTITGTAAPPGQHGNTGSFTVGDVSPLSLNHARTIPLSPFDVVMPGPAHGSAADNYAGPHDHALANWLAKHRRASIGGASGFRDFANLDLLLGRHVQPQQIQQMQHDLVVQDKHFLDLSIRAGGVRFLVHLMVAIQSELIWELLGPRGTLRNIAIPTSFSVHAVLFDTAIEHWYKGDYTMPLENTLKYATGTPEDGSYEPDLCLQDSFQFHLQMLYLSATLKDKTLQTTVIRKLADELGSPNRSNEWYHLVTQIYDPQTAHTMPYFNDLKNIVLGGATNNEDQWINGQNSDFLNAMDVVGFSADFWRAKLVRRHGQIV